MATHVSVDKTKRAPVQCLALAFATLAGCLSPQLPGETSTGGVLAADILRHVESFERALGYPGFTEDRVVNTEIVGIDGETVTERWTVSRDGEEVHYVITLTPSPRGGTDISITPADP